MSVSSLLETFRDPFMFRDGYGENCFLEVGSRKNSGNLTTPVHADKHLFRFTDEIEKIKITV